MTAADAYPSGNGHQPSEAPPPVAAFDREPVEERREAEPFEAPVSHEPEPLLRQEEYRPAPPREPEPATPHREEVAARTEEPPPPLPEPPHVEEEDDPSRPKRGGWWQRRSFF